MSSSVMLAATLASCATVRAPAAPAAPQWRGLPDGIADTVTTTPLGFEGVVLHHLVRNAGPLRIEVLDVDLASCVTLRAMKGGPTAVGRKTTSAMVHDLPSRGLLAAVNADFFVFAPPGVPVGALIEGGRVISGPIERPVLAFDARNRPYIGPLSVSTTIRSARASVDATAWNRPRARSIGIIDAAWAQPLDTLIRPTARLLAPVPAPLQPVTDPARRWVVRPMPAAHDGVATGDTLVLTGTGTTAIADGDTVTLVRRFTPDVAYNVVGGFPLLLRDSVPSPTLDTDGAESFRGLNPRTAAGVTRDGRRLFLVVIDGRRPGYSVGTTTRETAEVLRALGAVEAINLDGGGSSVLVVRDSTDAATRIVNRPSDAAGERPVGDALAVAGYCIADTRWQPPATGRRSAQ